VQPSATTAGAAITPAVQLTAQDAKGNTATQFTGNVTVALGTNLSGGALSGTTTIAAVGGVAAFNNLSIDKAGTGYTLAASSASLVGATSAPFTITPGPASQLVVTVPPTSTTGGDAPRALGPAVQRDRGRVDRTRRPGDRAGCAGQHGHGLHCYCDARDRREPGWGHAFRHHRCGGGGRRGDVPRVEHQQGGRGLHAHGERDGRDGGDERRVQHHTGSSYAAGVHDRADQHGRRRVHYPSG